jgi:hypothetical protein
VFLNFAQPFSFKKERTRPFGTWIRFRSQVQQWRGAYSAAVRERHTLTGFGQMGAAVSFEMLVATDIDWGVCIWPWQFFALGKAACPFFVPGYRCVPVKNMLDWSAVVFMRVWLSIYFL